VPSSFRQNTDPSGDLPNIKSRENYILSFHVLLFIFYGSHGTPWQNNIIHLWVKIGWFCHVRFICLFFDFYGSDGITHILLIFI